MRRCPAIRSTALLFAILCAAVQGGDAPGMKPNVLLIYADDLGYGELGCYGGKEVPTPNIDSIAAHGIRFTSGYVSAPLCSPSRAGLMTGRYQTRFGHENNTMTAERGLPLAETTLASRMKALGYATGMVGKWHLGADADYLPMKRGFDDYFGVTGNPGSYFKPNGFIDSRVSPEPQRAPEGFYTTDEFGAYAADWIEKHRASSWFLYLPFNAVHGPHQATEKYLQRFASVADRRRQQFDALLSGLDDAVGVVLAKLRELQLEEKTLVFFVSDNGAPGGRNGNPPLRGSKHTAWEGGIRVPWMVQWKGTFPEGKVDDRPVVQLDIMPTCVAVAGGTVEPAWKLDGVNLLPFLTGRTADRPHETLFWRIDGMWAVRHGDMKLVRGSMGAAQPELFDLAADVSEEKDLLAQQPEKAKELQALWDRWNSELASPSLPKEKHRGGKHRGERKGRKPRKAANTEV